MSTDRVITAEELSKHYSTDDMWMAINGKVYDVTKFLDDHPGGDEVMKDTAGTVLPPVPLPLPPSISSHFL